MEDQKKDVSSKCCEEGNVVATCSCMAKEKAVEVKGMAEKKIEEVKEMADEKMAEVKKVVEEKVEVAKEKLEEVKGELVEKAGEIKEKAVEMKENTEKYVKENPKKSAGILAGIAVVLGVVVASLFRKKK